MSRERTRRRLLRAAGTVTVASLAGCASAAKQLASEEGQPTSNPTTQGGSTPTTDAASTSTPTDADVSTPSQGTPDDGDSSESWSTKSVTIDPPDVGLSSVPVPDQRSQFARMGRAEATTTATLFGNWKCPYTQEFALTMLPELVDRFVEPGELQLEFRSVAYVDGDPFLGPDAPRASRAGLAVWDLDPQSYWPYFAHVFANQPQERYEWAQPSLLLRFAEASDVRGRSKLRQSIENGAYAGPVQQAASGAAERGIATVPRLLVDGTVTAPTVDFERTLSRLEDAVR